MDDDGCGFSSTFMNSPRISPSFLIPVMHTCRELHITFDMQHSTSNLKATTAPMHLHCSPVQLLLKFAHLLSHSAMIISAVRKS